MTAYEEIDPNKIFYIIEKWLVWCISQPFFISRPSHFFFFNKGDHELAKKVLFGSNSVAIALESKPMA